ncbi:MAG: GDP-mannose 4,6-dehydratase, partial [Fusobacteriaceae bacterium]
MKTYLITGGAGFIGSTLSEQILKNGNKVIAIDNFNDFYDYKIKLNNILEVNKKEWAFKSKDKDTNIVKLKQIVDSENYILEYVDIRDLKELERIFTENQIDIVIHLAGLGGVRPSIEDPLLYEEVNVRGTNNILEVMRKTGVKKI